MMSKEFAGWNPSHFHARCIYVLLGERPWWAGPVGTGGQDRSTKLRSYGFARFHQAMGGDGRNTSTTYSPRVAIGWKRRVYLVGGL